VIHGDDFTLLGDVKQLDGFRSRIENKFEVKFRARLGPSSNDDKSVRILNRVVTWTNAGIEYEADQRHSELICEGLEIGSDSNGVNTPGVKTTEDKRNIPLVGNDAVMYRAHVARGNYLAQDRSNIQYAVKELCRSMSAPTQADWINLKRLARYLKRYPRVVTKYPYQGEVSSIVVWTDTDFAGCESTRKSTNGGVMQLGLHTVKSWSSTQAGVALSSGEAEYYGLVKGASQAIGLRSLLGDLGVDAEICVNTDASAAKGIASRRGLGKRLSLTRSTQPHPKKVQPLPACCSMISQCVNRVA
jgi:hypothetical protein